MGLAEPPTVTSAVRLYHLTFYKCGSQWIRDVLSDPRIVIHTGHPLSATGIDLQSERWPDIETGQFAGPLYSAGSGDWGNRATESDRAFVVIRDPRDVVVSLVFSVSLSHTPTAVTRLLRKPLVDATPSNRLRLGMFLFAQWSEQMRSWRSGNEFTTVHLAHYESLIHDLPGELRRLFVFLQWPVPDDVVNAVAAENSFQCRSGRSPGEENEFSHRRKGIAGDWRNHFDRQLGEAFETAFPALLTDLGYESSNDWWQALPASVPPHDPSPDEQRLRLLAVLEEHEKELATIRLAAEERLRDIHVLHELLRKSEAESQARQDDAERLHLQLTEQTEVLAGRQKDLEFLRTSVHQLAHQQEEAKIQSSVAAKTIAQIDHLVEQINASQSASTDLLQQIGGLSTRADSLESQLHTAQIAADERLADILSREAAQRELESSVAWRFGFKPIRALTSLLRK